MRRLLRDWVVLLPLIMAQASAAPTLDVAGALWGFTGKPVLEAFNPLTLEIVNLTAEPYGGTIQLERQIGGRPAGIREIQPISLGPLGRRTVQFTPYVDDMLLSYSWRVSWESGWTALSDSLLPLESGPPATVEFVGREGLLQSPTAQFATFPEHYFPTNVSATAGLSAVVLSQGPNWEEARATAFWQWLQRGGQLHLFPTRDGQAIRFAGILSPLNDPSAGSFGYGRVWRHAQQASALPAAEWEKIRTEAPQERPTAVGQDSVFRSFGTITLPDIPWALIYLAALVYLFLIGPGHYLFARNSRRDYRVILLSLIALVGAFSWLFTKIGRRGFGESNRWLSASIAFPLGETGSYDVMQWSHAFVTRGDTYAFRHSSAHQLFEVEHRMEDVPGFLRGGAQGFLNLDLPLYSSRNMTSRSVLKGPPISVRVHRWSARDHELEVEVAIPRDIAVERAWYRYDNAYIALMEKGMNRWVNAHTDRTWGQARGNFRSSRERAGDLERLQDEHLPNDLLHWNRYAREQTGSAAQHAELLLYARAPDSFHPVSPNFDEHFGRVLYVIPLANYLAALAE